jgi:hypothetical protein
MLVTASVVYWSEFLATDMEARVRFPALPEKKLWVWNGVHSASWVQLRSYLIEKSSGSCLETREYGRKDSSRWPRDTVYTKKLALTPPTSGCHSVGIVRLRTKAAEFIYTFLYHCRTLQECRTGLYIYIYIYTGCGKPTSFFIGVYS